MIAEVFLVSVVASVVGWILYIKIQHRRYNHIPQPPRKSFFYGNADLVRESVRKRGVNGAYQLELVRKYGEICCYWFMTTPRVIIADPMLLKEMLTDHKRFLRELQIPLAYIGRTRILGYHSILSDEGGPIWRRKRQVMNPVFSLPKLTESLSKFYSIAADVVTALEKARMDTADGLVDMKKVIIPFAIDAISYAGFSADEEQRKGLVDANCRTDQATRLLLHGKGAFMRLFDHEARSILSDCEKAASEARELGKSLVYDRISSDDFSTKQDLLNKIIEANIIEESGELDLDNCLDDFLTMYIAGNATTSTAICWVVAELIRHPVALERLVQEVDDIWRASNIDRDTEYVQIGQALKEMVYLDAVVKEIMRLRPPVSFSGKINASDENFNGYYIPKGTSLNFGQYVMHRFEKFWDNPDIFDPDRFIKGNPKPYTYFPFSLGIRQCIGKNFAILELKVILCEILKNYELHAPEGGPKEVECYQAVIWMPQKVDVVVTPRF